MSELLRQAELHHIGGGRGTCTPDLLVMSQASCCCSIPQVVTQGVEPRMRFLGCFTGSCSTVERDHRVWIIGDLNPAPPACKAGALPNELMTHGPAEMALRRYFFGRFCAEVLASEAGTRGTRSLSA